MRQSRTSMLPVVAAALIAVPALLSACSSTPTGVSEGGAGASETAKPALDPERVTKLSLYGGRYVGEPSSDGIAGVTGVELEVGQAFISELYFAGGTGYSWFASGFDESVVEMSDKRSRPVTGTDAVGARQMCTMRFTAKKPGRTRVTFELKRAWETTEAPAEVRHTTMYVK